MVSITGDTSLEDWSGRSYGENKYIQIKNTPVISVYSMQMIKQGHYRKISSGVP